jgi:5'-3' exoribonuclease 2
LCISFFQESPIIDFYPEDFKIDLNGKKFAWQGVALLPFVNEDRLFKALAPYYKELSPAEIKRNVRGDDRLYVGSKNPGYNNVRQLYVQKIDMQMEVHVSIQGMQGLVLLTEESVDYGG